MSIEKDVVYYTANGRPLQADIYRPEGQGVPTRSAVLLFHGGGWVIGHRSMIGPLAVQFAALGFLAVTVEYRLVGEASWPAQLDDAVAAVRWTADNAERLGVDPERIVVAGSSAGGHLALLAAATLRDEPRVAAVLSFFAASALAIDSKPAKGVFDATILLGSNSSEEALQAASPLQRITADFPPVFLLHGSADWLIDPIASLRVYEKLVSLGVPTELHIVALAHHEFITQPAMTGAMISEAAFFLNRVLIDPERWDEEAKANNLFANGPEALQALMAGGPEAVHQALRARGHGPAAPS